MALEPRHTTVHVDQDGVRLIREPGVRPSVWIIAAVLAALALALLLFRPDRLALPDAKLDTGTHAATNAKAPPGAPPPAYRPVRRQEPEVPAALKDPPARPPAVIDADAAGATAAEDGEQPTGIALFPPPGTDPIKHGLIVPEDFELPPGYVRHYQATDDGQRLPAILMFHPDYDWVDENGRPIEIPADHIVPPELAPAGLPLQTLDVPEPDIPMIEQPGDAEPAD